MPAQQVRVRAAAEAATVQAVRPDQVRVRSDKPKGNVYYPDLLREPDDLGKSEWVFRRLYAGKHLVFIGGAQKPHQVEKLLRMGCKLEWLGTGHDHQNGKPKAIVTAVSRTDADFLFLWKRHISHPLFYRVREVVDQLNLSRVASGRPKLRSLVGSTMNTEDMARLFLQGVAGADVLGAIWQRKRDEK